MLVDLDDEVMLHSSTKRNLFPCAITPWRSVWKMKSGRTAILRDAEVIGFMMQVVPLVSKHEVRPQANTPRGALALGMTV